MWSSAILFVVDIKGKYLGFFFLVKPDENVMLNEVLRRRKDSSYFIS